MREVILSGRRYWIISEPEGDGWSASVVEVLDSAADETEPIGIDAGGATRSAADEAAARKLRRLLQTPDERG
jgi:hypothetical protein